MSCFPRIPRPVAAGFALGVFAWIAAVAYSADTKLAYQKVASLEGITEYRLDNGLRFLLFPDQSTPNVTVNLTVLVGSRHEGYGETGMAHLLEHMLFKGTPTHKDIPKLLKDRGAQRNATTAYDRTNYYETLAGTDDNLNFALRLEADRFVNSLIRREDLASEMTVVRSEFEQGENNPQSVLFKRMMAVAFEWHNYGKTIIGNRSDIERVPIERLQSFYKKYYRPDNAVLMVAGKFKPEKALQLITKYFGVIKRPKVKLDATYTDEPAQDGERMVILRRVGKVGSIGALYHIPAAAHPDYAALVVLADVLDVAPSGRLYKALVETKLASSVNCSNLALHDPGVFIGIVQLNADSSISQVRSKLIGLLESQGSADFTSEEVERIKRKYQKTRETLLNNSNQVGLSISEWIARGDWRLVLVHYDRIAKVTPADVKRVAGKYLRKNNRTLGLYVPTAQPDRIVIPETPSVAQIVKNYRGKDTVKAGEIFDPTPENIEKRVQRGKLGVGIKTAFLPKKTRGEMVTVNLTLRFGNEESLFGKNIAAQFMGSLMMRGTKKYTRQQLDDELDKLGAQLDVSTSLGALRLSVRVKRKDLVKSLALAKEILRYPTFPATDFDILKRRRKVGLERLKTEPQMLAVQALQRKLQPYPSTNVRYLPTLEEQIARLDAATRDDVVKLYREQINGDFGELTAVGDFDPKELAPIFEIMLAEWKSKVKVVRIARPAQTTVPGSREDILTPDKENAVFIGGQMLAMKDTDPDYPALRIGNFILGSDGLSSRLGNRVRQKDGLSYTVFSQFSADFIDPSGSFFVFANCKPTNINKLDKAIAEEIARFLKNGVTDKELADAKDGYLRSLKRNWAGDGSIAGLLGSGLREGWTFQYFTDLEKKIHALTPQAVVKACQKHLQPKRLVIIRAGDFKKKAAVPKK